MCYNVTTVGGRPRDRRLQRSEAIRLDPKYLRAYTNRADAYRAKGEEDCAVAYYDEVNQLIK